MIRLFLLWFLAAAATLPAQNSVYDSVRTSIAHQPRQRQFEVMEGIADSLLNGHPYQALPFTHEAIRLAHEVGNKTEEGYLLNSLSSEYQSIGDFDRSGGYARQALILNLEVKHEYEVARSYGIIALTYNYMGLYTNAMEYSLKALTIYEQLNKTRRAAGMMNSIGTIYLRLKQYEKAGTYFNRTLKIVQQNDTTSYTMLLLNNIASIHASLGRPDSALQLLDPLLALARSRHLRGVEAYTCFNIGSAYSEKHDPVRAVYYFQKAREASASIHEAHGEAEALLGIARVYLMSGRNRNALSILTEAIPLCRRTKTYDFLRSALDMEHTAYERFGDVRHALATLQAYTALTDSVFTIAEKFGVDNAVFSSDLGKKEEEIARLRRDAARDEVSIATKQYQIYALAAFILAVIAAAIALVIMYRKAHRLHNIEIEQKKKIETLYDQLSRVVSDRNLADEQTREVQQKFQAVWEKSVDGMRLTDRDGTMLMVNEAFCRMVGMDREALTGKPLSVIYNQSGHERVIRVYKDRFSRKQVEAFFEHKLVLRDASAKWFEGTNSYIDIEDQPPLLLGIFRDISQRKRLEEQLVQSQKLEGIGTLAGGIAHDFNNLLAMILGSAEMLQHQSVQHPEVQKHVDQIVEASVRGTSISRQLLIFSRPDQAVLKPISLSDTIAELQEMLKHFLPKSITITVLIDTGDDIILGDAGQIQQALLNLAINAGDAMGNRGMLTIRKYTVSQEFIGTKFQEHESRPYIALSVCDTGVGMDEALKAKIFDPFFTTKERNKGTGLGLSSVHGIVKNHGGLIDVESAPGAGSTFTLYLPVAEKSVQLPAVELLPHAAPSIGTVLLVDDETIIRETMAEYLHECGYTVHAASGGREALEVFQAQHATIDIVLTDLGMPEMGGEELFRHLKDIDPAVKVIVSSGYLDGTSKKDLLKDGVKEVLTKPVRMEDIHSAIRIVLDAVARTAPAFEA